MVNEVMTSHSVWHEHSAWLLSDLHAPTYPLRDGLALPYQDCEKDCGNGKVNLRDVKSSDQDEDLRDSQRNPNCAQSYERGQGGAEEETCGYDEQD